MSTLIAAVLVFSVLMQTHCKPDEMDSLSMFLTPYLESGQIEEAQKLSRVHELSDDGDDVETYSGYLTVNETYGSNIFFWFCPAEVIVHFGHSTFLTLKGLSENFYYQPNEINVDIWRTSSEETACIRFAPCNNPADAPVLLWLNGGPGRSSLIGALLENGPYQLTEEGRVKRRPVSWTQSFSMLYLDNPVGAGYSFTLDEAGMSTNTEDAAVNLYSALVQVFKLFPQYLKNDFYIGGQSYAGKYIPVLGRYIHDRNTDTSSVPDLHINFKGIYLGAGFCDPENMMPILPEYIYSFGIISDAERQRRRSEFTTLVADGLSGKYPYKKTWDYMSRFFSIAVPSMDHLLGTEYTNTVLLGTLRRFMHGRTARTKLHAGFSKNDIRTALVANALRDFLTTTRPENAFLMNNYKVLHYSGNLDVVVNVPMTEAFLDHVDWAGQAEYRLAYRSPWRVDGQLMGWVITVRNFTRVVIRNSGHMVPFDQPKAALEMMNRFVFGRPFETSAPSPAM